MWMIFHLLAVKTLFIILEWLFQAHFKFVHCKISTDLYLWRLMKQCNVQVRSVSARALGAMVRGMGESSFEDLLPWLMQTLTSESSSVDRSGAAQGISEVVGGLGVEKLRKLMPGEWLLITLLGLQTRNKCWKLSLLFHYFKPNNIFLSIYSRVSQTFCHCVLLPLFKF